MTLQKVMEVIWKELHDQNREIGGREEANTEELYNVRVAEVLQEVALIDELYPELCTLLHKDIASVQPLPSAQGATKV